MRRLLAHESSFAILPRNAPAVTGPGTGRDVGRRYDLGMQRRLEDLVSTGDLALARHVLSAWDAPTIEQERVRDRMLAFIDEHPADAHKRTCVPGHLTASALVIDAQGERALLTHHRKLGRWLQLGGHCDGDANLAAVALREAIEESGIEDLSIDPPPVDVDIHTIPARPAKDASAAEPEHLHLDTRFLVHAPAGARATASSESNELRWFTPDEVDEIETDDSVLRLVRLAFPAR
jgi:8-oxo-dGTP pyrophosphatase MutT (NUDIX family)